MIWNNLIYFYMFQIFLNFSHCQDHVVNENLTNYLNGRLKRTTTELTNMLNQNSDRKDIQTSIKFHTVTTINASHNYLDANIFSLFNETYVLIGNQLYNIVLIDNTLALKKYTDFVKIQQRISFIKTTEFGNLGLMFISLPSDYSYIYGYLNNTGWFLIQSISHTNTASDANFFTNKNNLYLIITNAMERSLTYSVIYKWTGAYFDAIDKILMKDASTVLSFPSHQSEIIIIAQNFTNEQTHNLAVHEFSNDVVRKVQLMVVKSPNHIVTYVYLNKQYLTIFEETKNSTLYWWDGSELTSLMKFNNFSNIQKILSVNINEIPVIFLIQADHLFTLSHSSNGLHLISELKLNISYKKIVDMKLHSYKGTETLLIFLLTSDNELNYVMIPFSIYIVETESEMPEIDILLQCLSKLKKAVDENNHKLDAADKTSVKIIHDDKPLQFRGRIHAASAHVETANVAQVKSRIDSLTDRLNALNPKLQTLFEEGDVIHGNLIIAGDLHAEQVSAKNLHVKYLNQVRWTPNMWLSYSQPQTITGAVSTKNLLVKNLNVSDHAILNDILRSDNQNISSTYVLNSLTADNIYTAKINEIPFKNVYLRSKPVIISGLKEFNNLGVNKLQTTYLNDEDASKMLEKFTKPQSKNLEFASNMYIKNFNFEDINGVNWKNFKDSVFRKNITKRITGNLTIPQMEANKLYAKTISNIDTSTMVTTTTDQNISTTLYIQSIYADHVICNKINDVDVDNIVTPENNFIRGPVSIENLHVRGNLKVNRPVDNSSEQIRGDHIIGTNESDLLQIYTKKVKIIGNLNLTNILISNATKIVINNKEFKADLKNYYWSKTQNQVIQTFVEAQKGITTPHLSSVLLNNIPISNYMINNLEDKLPANLVFENATIVGNVIINQTAKHTPDLRKLDLEAVKLTGRFNITGHKTVQGKISVGNLITNYLDEIKVSDVVTSATDTVSGTKMFENVIISKNVVADNIVVNILNNVPLKTLVDEVLFIDKPTNIETLKFHNVTASTIHTAYMNKINFNEYIEKFNKNYEIKTLNNVVVNGNVEINSVQQLSHINGYNINNLQSNIIRRNNSIMLQNNIRFLGNVFAENIEVIYINNVDFPNLISRLLYRDWDQNITAPYIFDKLTAPNIFTPQINDIPTNNLINIRDPNPQNLLVWGGLQLSSPKFMKSVDAELLTCNIQQAIMNLKNPPTRYWNNIHVKENITLWDDYCDLSNIFENSVNVKKNNIIQAPVTFKQPVSANMVYAQKLINGINLNEILEDALLKDVDEQIVTGKKRFKQLIISNALVEGNAIIPIINENDIALLDQSIIRRSNVYDSIIRGRKVFFTGLQANRLISNTICDLNPENLVSLAALRKIPDAYFQTLEIENNFNVEYINDISISDRLSERLLRNSPEQQFASGTYYFDNALLIGNSNITAINDLVIEDIVLDQDIQVILTAKTLSQDVVVDGNVVIGSINGQDVSETYKQAILSGESTTIKGNIKFNNTVLVTNNIQADNINGMPVKYLLDHLQSDAPVVQTEIVRNTMKQIENVITENFRISSNLPDKYLYLEKSDELQISIPNAISAYAFEIKDNVMLHVVRQEQGSVCALPDVCSCPIQETIQITAELSINTIAEIGTQRIFSYEDGEMSIHLFSNSISTSETCRTNDTIASAESTSLVWMTYFQNKSAERYFDEKHLTGYVSGVEYFRINGFVYMIVSRYYDPINNTHSLDCLVYKFTKDNMKVHLIQTIKTNGAWTLYLLHTVQGINLVIGSVSDSEKLNINYGAEIYRFNETAEEFVLLRKVASAGCTSAVGVALGPDSLFILAQKDAPLQVLKYHPKYDNYYFYQSIFLDSLVTGLSVFYTGYFGISDPLLCIVTQSSNFYIYSFQFVQGWHVVSSGEIEGLHTLVPFVLNHKHYLFALSTNYTTLLTVVKHGSN